MKPFYTSVEKYGNLILHTYYDESGKRKFVKEKYKPYLFVEDKNGQYSSLMDNSKKLKRIEFETISAMRDWIKDKKEISNFEYFGMENIEGQFIADRYLEDIEYDKSLINMVSFDIEVDITEKLPNIDEADLPITCISSKSSKSDKYWLFYYEGEYKNEEHVTGVPDKNVIAVKCKDEKDLLRKFVMWWINDYPDVLTGYNIDGFDVPYTVNRIRRLLGDEWVDKLSYWQYVKEHEFDSYGQIKKSYRFAGMTVLDFMDIFKKFGSLTYGTLASYKLDNVAYVVLGDRKVDYGEYGNLNGLWANNKNLYYQYNVKDTVLIQRMEDETALISLVYSVAYSSGVNLIDALGTVFLWDCTFNRECLRDNVVIPMAPRKERGGSIVGGYVKDPQKGLFKNIVSFDLSSLYPHIMMQYNISPETYRGQKPGKSPDFFLDGGENMDNTISMCANGAYYTNDFVGIIPKIIKKLYAQRKAAKKEMLEWEQKKADGDHSPEVSAKISSLNSLQMAIKVRMNGLYGAMAQESFRFYKLVMAEGITTSGQLAVRWSKKEIDKFLNEELGTKDVEYTIYCDTDSNYVNLDEVVKKYLGNRHHTREEVEEFLDKYSKEKIQPIIARGYEKMAKLLKAKENAMDMKREKICGSAIFVAKKRYCLLVYNSEGVHYSTPKVAVTGIEAVRSNTPDICKEALIESFRVMLTNGEEATQKYIEEFKEKFMKSSVYDIGRITGVKGIEDYTDPETGSYKKGCPIHVRASIVFNDNIKKYKLDNEIGAIQTGDKIKYVYLKEPNPIGENVIGFINDYLPEQFGVDKYVDYKLQFDKVFENPLSTVMEACGWSTEKQDTLDEWF